MVPANSAPENKRPSEGSWVFHLPDEIRWELLNYLGIERTGTFQDEFELQNTLQDVEIELGNYPLVVELLDNAPKPAHFRNELRSILAGTDRLLSRLHLLGERTRGLLAVWLTEDGAPNLADFERHLMALRDTASHAIASVERSESRGRPAKLALALLIDRLRAVFAREYRGSASAQRQRTGSVEDLSERENDEREFVALALSAGHIERPDDLGPFFLSGEVRSGESDQGELGHTAGEMGQNDG